MLSCIYVIYVLNFILIHLPSLLNLPLMSSGQLLSESNSLL